MTTLLDTPTSKFLALGRLVGNTPMVTIQYHYRGCDRLIYAKSEYLNLTGSIKDRMALRILQQAYTEGKDCARLYDRRGHQRQHRDCLCGHWAVCSDIPSKIFMPDWMSQERVQLIRVTARKSFPSAKKMAVSSAASACARSSPHRASDVFLPRQFSKRRELRCA